MSHRAEQIITAAREAIAAEFRGAVYEHRAFSMLEDEGELPAVSVDYGADDPPDDDGASNFAFFDSFLTVETAIYIRGTEESTVKKDLLDARRAIHVALMADRTLGLPFVIDTRYGGADAPEFNTDGEYLAGLLVCRWLVHYRMNISDPS